MGASTLCEKYEKLANSNFNYLPDEFLNDLVIRTKYFLRTFERKYKKEAGQMNKNFEIFLQNVSNNTNERLTKFINSIKAQWKNIQFIFEKNSEDLNALFSNENQLHENVINRIIAENPKSTALNDIKKLKPKVFYFDPSKHSSIELNDFEEILENDTYFIIANSKDSFNDALIFKKPLWRKSIKMPYINTMHPILSYKNELVSLWETFEENSIITTMGCLNHLLLIHFHCPNSFPAAWVMKFKKHRNYYLLQDMSPSTSEDIECYRCLSYDISENVAKGLSKAKPKVYYTSKIDYFIADNNSLKPINVTNDIIIQEQAEKFFQIAVQCFFSKSEKILLNENDELMDIPSRIIEFLVKPNLIKMELELVKLVNEYTKYGETHLSLFISKKENELSYQMGYSFKKNDEIPNKNNFSLEVDFYYKLISSISKNIFVNISDKVINFIKEINKDSKSLQILNLVTNYSILLTAIKTQQALKQTGKFFFKNDDQVVYNCLSYLVDLKVTKKLSIAAIFDSNFLIIVEDIPERQSEHLAEFSKSFVDYLLRSPSNKILLITPVKSNFTENIQKFINECLEVNSNDKDNHKFYEKVVDECQFSELAEKVQRFLLNKEVMFQGKKFRISQLLDGRHDLIDPATVEKLIKNVDIQIGIGGNYIYKKNYTERKIYAIEIDEAVFEYHDGKHFNMVLAIENTADFKLRQYLKGKGFVTQNEGEIKKYYNLNTLVSKVFILDRSKAAVQFQQICKNHESVHWLKLESTTLLWYQSFGSIDPLMPFIKTRTNLFNQKEFYNYIYENQIMLVSDIAEIGKTTLCSNLIEIISEKNPRTWILKIHLRYYLNILQRIKEKGLEELPLKLKFKYSFDNDYGRTLLESFYKNPKNKEEMDYQYKFEYGLFEYYFNNGKMLFLFDGFDEIAPDYENIVLEIIMKIKNKTNNIIWINTRNCSKKLLETKLNAVSYRLQPLSLSRQIEKLTDLWITRCIESDRTWYEKCINEYSTLSDQGFQKINGNFNNILSSPFQISMVKEILCQKNSMGMVCFEYMSKIYAKLFVFEQDIELSGLYEVFFKNKISIMLEEKKKEERLLPILSEKKKMEGRMRSKLNSTNEVVFEQHFEYYRIYGVEAIDGYNSTFPTLEEKLELQKSEISKAGIIDFFKNGKAYFVHHTYAEFFAASYLSKKIVSQPEFTLKIINDILKKHLTSFGIFIRELLMKENVAELKSFLNGIPLLNYFTKKGLKNGMKLFIDDTCFPTHDNDNKTILHHAAEYEHENLVFYLLVYIFTIFFENPDISTPNASHDAEYAIFCLSEFIKLKDKNLKTAIDYWQSSNIILSLLIKICDDGLKYQEKNGFESCNIIEEIVRKQKESNVVIEYLDDKRFLFYTGYFDDPDMATFSSN